MSKAFQPLFAGPGTISGHRTIFHTEFEKVLVEAPASLMRKLIILCDGMHTIDQVIQNLEEEWDGATARELIESLCQKKVILDSANLCEEMWGNMKNPSHYPNLAINADVAIELAQKARERHERNPSQKAYPAKLKTYGSLLSRRQSTRMFTGDSVAFQSLVNILWSAYGLCEPQADGLEHRTVGSAGALYPLMIHVALFKHTGDLEPGIYKLYMGLKGSVGFHLESSDILRFCRSFIVNPVILQKAHGVVVISGSFDVSGEKYGNRSVLYVSLEAGSTAQNIHVSAIENGVGTVELGGFTEASVVESLNLEEGYHPLTTIAFGERDENAQPEDVSQKMEFRWVTPTNNRYRPPFAIVSARLAPKRSWSNGRDASPVLANIKAIAEAKEWMACGCVPDLAKARFVELETAIDPRNVIRFNSAQYRLKRFPFRPFDEQEEYEWAVGCNEVTGCSVHVLADLVYFPYYPGRRYYAYANSSGVAAYPDQQRAIEIATLELVERDAFTIAYLARLDYPTIDHETLPAPIIKRIDELQRVGFEVTVKDHSIDLAPVACVIVQNKELGCTACASCSKFEMEQAIDHALMETEAFVMARFENGQAEPITPTQVEMPLDHGKLYDQRQYFHRADFLIRGQKSIPLKVAGEGVAKSWQDLLDRFASKGWSLVTVPLYLSDGYGGNGDLSIVRAIVPGMVPMTFGYRQEPAGMDRIYTIAKAYGSVDLSYADLTKFPHPFA